MDIIKRKKEINNSAGFTLAELSIIIAIITILSVIVLAGNREGQKVFTLHRVSNKLAQDLRSVQNRALIGETFLGNFPSGGYGIYFNQGASSYIVYADCNNNKKYDGSALTCPDCTSGSCNPDIASEKVEEISMEQGIQIANILPGYPLSVTFYPPRPIVTLDYGSASSTEASIIVSNGTEYDTVLINSIGLIDIN